MTRIATRPPLFAALFAAGLLSAALPARAQAPSQAPPRVPASKPWSFRVGAGGVWIGGGDMAEAIRGLNADRAANHSDVSGLFAPVRWGLSWSAELSYRTSPRFDLFLSASGLRAGRESQVTSTWWAFESEQTLRPSCRGILVAAGAGWRALPLAGGGGIRFYAGVGAVFGGVTWETSQSLVSPSMEERARGSWSSDATAPAAVAGMTLDVVLTPGLALVADAGARWAVLSELAGRYDATVSDFSGSTTSSGTTSAWYALYASGGSSVPWLVFNETKPTAAFYRDVRPFRLGLSGFSASLGLRFRF